MIWYWKKFKRWCAKDRERKNKILNQTDDLWLTFIDSVISEKKHDQIEQINVCQIELAERSEVSNGTLEYYTYINISACVLVCLCVCASYMLSPLTRWRVTESVFYAVCRHLPSWMLILRPIALILLCVALRHK